MKEKLIFIVDDDEMLSGMLFDRLSSNPNYTVQLYPTGEECLKALDQHPDVIILDYYLNTIEPDAANGMEILQEIKKIDKHITVIMLSSQEQYGKAVQTIVKGALEYVVKGQDAFDRIETIIRAQP
jgi:two-component system, OmpR family, response regulator